MKIGAISQQQSPQGGSKSTEMKTGLRPSKSKVWSTYVARCNQHIPAWNLNSTSKKAEYVASLWYMKSRVKWYTPKISQKHPKRISCSISSVIGVLSFGNHRNQVLKVSCFHHLACYLLFFLIMREFWPLLCIKKTFLTFISWEETFLVGLAVV